MHKEGGRLPRLSVLDKLVITLRYYHDYRTMVNIAFDYEVSKSRISDAVKWVEETLIMDGTFALPAKRELKEAGTDVVIAVADVTECETERPKKNRKSHIQASKNAIQ
ncbi:MAG: transposase family protein [Oscillospiraceae bacterium]|nr:transposase family protein [Oscillospiraceae bacterium]